MAAETPRVTYGFSGFVNYSNFEFSFAFQGSGKRSFFMDPSELSPFVDDHAMLTAIYKDHWSEDNMIRGKCCSIGLLLQEGWEAVVILR